MGWKIEDTETDQNLARRSLATMHETTPRAAVEAERKRIHMPGVVPLSRRRSGSASSPTGS